MQVAHLVRPFPYMRVWQLLAYRRGEHTPEPDLVAIDPAFREVILHMTQLDPGMPSGISISGHPSNVQCVWLSKPAHAV